MGIPAVADGATTGGTPVTIVNSFAAETVMWPRTEGTTPGATMDAFTFNSFSPLFPPFGDSAKFSELVRGELYTEFGETVTPGAGTMVSAIS